jgi:hypothetical protein
VACASADILITGSTEHHGRVQSAAAARAWQPCSGGWRRGGQRPRLPCQDPPAVGRQRRRRVHLAHLGLGVPATHDGASAADREPGRPPFERQRAEGGEAPTRGPASSRVASHTCATHT